MEMENTDKVKELLQAAEEDLRQYKFDPLSFEEKAKEVLEKLYTPEGEYGLTGSKNRSDPHSPYKRVAMFLFDKGYTSSAIDVLVRRWEELASLQNKETHVYRASISMQLAEFYLQLKDEGAALRWLLLTYADDLLDSRNEGAGKQKLKARLGMTQNELNKLAERAKKNVEKVLNSGDWSIAEGFAEDVIVRFMVENSELVNLFAKDSFVTAFPLSKTYFSRLIQLAANDYTDTDRKGRHLEYLASYLIWLIPAWVPLRNMQDRKQTFENDIVVRNLSRNAVPNLLGEYFLVECKNKHKTENQTGKVGSPDVGYFLYRMHLTGCKLGMIFAWEGLSGATSEEKRNALGLTEKGFHKDGITCIVLGKNDYQDLVDGRKNFLGLLVELMEKFRFGRPKKQE